MTTRPLILDPAGQPVMSAERAEAADVQERQALERALVMANSLLLEAWGCLMGLHPAGGFGFSDVETLAAWRNELVQQIRDLVGDRAVEQRFGVRVAVPSERGAGS
jgi:hypothetical protein